MTPVVGPRDLRMALIAKRHGMKNSLRTIIEARRAGLPISLGFAVIEQESGDGSNCFGHDDVRNSVKSPQGGKLMVTKARYDRYLVERRAGHGDQGVGPAQLTYHTVQDRADARGGCWVPKHNMAEAFGMLAALIARHGADMGIAAYNAGESGWRNGKGYADEVQAKERAWHRRLT